MAELDPAISAHLEWLGFVRPTGLVVSAPALVKAGVLLNRHDTEGHQLLRECVEERVFDTAEGPVPCLPDLHTFVERVLGWCFSPKGYAGTDSSPIPAELEVPLPEYGETLRPDFAVRERDPQNAASSWQVLVRHVDLGQDFDRSELGPGGFEASAHGRMEQLLRRTQVSAGLLFNGRAIRLISAPYGESSGWLDFRVSDMVQTAGRPICTALRLLLSEHRLLSLPRHQRLAALLDDSRKFQNEVSERLAEQVLHALYELLRGLQGAHDASGGVLLRQPLTEHPDTVYHALLTVILRLVFLLYAEERDMLPQDETFLRYYSLSGLYERLREDAALYPDTMDQRYGAWAQLLVLFRMMHGGAEWGATRLPKRQGALFSPERFPFLEGCAEPGEAQRNKRSSPPLVPDGTIYRALEKLLVLDGERLSYRALDVEQIGSVYETMMGFRLETATGRSAAIRAAKKHGAPTTIDLEALLDEPPAQRRKWIQDRTDRKLTERVLKAVRGAQRVENLHAALDPVLDKLATPDLVPRGAMVLQPSAERRRSGSHYTPRALTAPVVHTALEPVLARLCGPDGRPPRSSQLLDLKICDLAMGSGAFLVEACRRLGDVLVESWRVHGGRPALPPDETEVILARRLITQRCLYGVDRNPVAVDLAKVSLWLVTLAKDHPLTFVDHALRHGDSLVGLSHQQIEAFHWEANATRFQEGFETMRVRERVEKISTARQLIQEPEENVSDEDRRELWEEAQQDLSSVLSFGDLAVAAFFQGAKPKERKAKRGEYADAIVNGEAQNYDDWLQEWRHAEPPLAPFHWEIEFPEVFERENPGFDVVVGNPPFAGNKTIAAGNVQWYLDWLKALHEQSHGNSDLVAHFFRRAFNLLRQGGAFGLIATNTISQGDTRATGLRRICKNGGELFRVRRRVPWPGQAAVVVSILHVAKGGHNGPKYLDGQEVGMITAFLFHRGNHDDPARLMANKGKSFQGSNVLGMGFTFDDTDKKDVASPLAEMNRLIEKNPRNQEAIFPYIAGAEVNEHPTHKHHRYVMNFYVLDLKEAERRWPDLIDVVRQRVKPERDTQKLKDRRERWWQYTRKCPELYAAIANLKRVLVISQVSTHVAFAFLPNGMVYAHRLVVFPFDTYAAFCMLQARPHDVWVHSFGASFKDDPTYTPTDCFANFPFLEDWGTSPALEAAGQAYYDFRANLMVHNWEGMTTTYNRFHDPNERDPDIVKLRALHEVMDRAVLDAYGWSDVPTVYEFLLDYEFDEEDDGSRRRKPWRYRWPDEIRDEVLVRLLALNGERAAAEIRSGAAAAKKRGRKSATMQIANTGTPGELFS